jgi:hypothetical protein
LRNVDLTGNVWGTATGSIRYRFDCSSDGTWESDNTTYSDPYTKYDLCDYPSSGAYTARLRVDRSGVSRICTTSISVSQPTPTPTNTPTPRPTNSPTPRPTATNTPRPTATNTPRPTNTPTSTPPPSENTLQVRVSSSSNDAEECVSSGGMYLDSSDIEMVRDDNSGGGSACTGEQIVGLRFEGIVIPQGSDIKTAYIQFTTDETDSEATNLTIYGEDTDDSLVFTNSVGNISQRTKTTSFTSWSPPAWSSVGQSGQDQQTPDLSSIVQEIIQRPGWTTDNSLSFIIQGTGKRTAESYNGSSSKAPLLILEYDDSASSSTPTPTQCTPTNGDGNGDGKATPNDFAIWAYYFELFNPVEGGPGSGDFNCDGHTNANDFAIWAYYFTPY